MPQFNSLARQSYRLATLTVIATVVAVPATCYARLGETAQTCVQRYGNALKVTNESDGVHMKFDKNGVSILCVFDSDRPTSKCEYIAYENFGRFDVIESILELNSQGSKWGNSIIIEHPGFPSDYEWMREDGGSARWMKIFDRSALSIRSKEYNEKKKRREQDQKKEQIKGL